MKYWAWIGAVSTLNLAVIFSASWSLLSLIVITARYFTGKDFILLGQPYLFIAVLLLGIINTPLTAVPFVKYPDRFKNNIMILVIIPAVLLTLGLIFALYYTFNIYSWPEYVVP